MSTSPCTTEYFDLQVPLRQILRWKAAANQAESRSRTIKLVAAVFATMPLLPTATRQTIRERLSEVLVVGQVLGVSDHNVVLLSQLVNDFRIGRWSPKVLP
mmetsp:Transcript_1231/g.3811  ORF Transcript_1231/g.3811 Transcript_1231/m.3811 type:complete len:101 (-) Transcript_1231:954-1256(-)